MKLNTQHNTCIWCNEKEADAESHIVPNSFRKNLWGLETKTGKKFSFKYKDRIDLPSQDFPKPHLMCRGCDSNLGGMVERNIPRLMIPKVMDVEGWNKLPLYTSLVGTFEGQDLSFPAYDYLDPEASELERFATSVAWRALHAEASWPTAPKMLKEFMATPKGQLLDRSTKKYIAGEQLSECNGFQIPDMWCLPPQLLVSITNDEEQLPISWSVTGDSKVEAVLVLFGYWLVYWRVNFDQPQNDKTKSIVSWLGALRKQYSAMNA